MFVSLLAIKRTSLSRKMLLNQTATLQPTSYWFVTTPNIVISANKEQLMLYLNLIAQMPF